MKRTLRVVSCVATLVVAGGCVSSRFISIQGAVYPPKDTHCDIEVFSSVVPDREYEEIGIVEADTELLNTFCSSGLRISYRRSWKRSAWPEGTPSSIQSSSTFSGRPARDSGPTHLRCRHSMEERVVAPQRLRASRRRSPLGLTVGHGFPALSDMRVLRGVKYGE